MQNRIIEKLEKNLQPKFLEVKNNSAQHRGHSGDNGTDETHFAIIIEAEGLKELGRVPSHRKVKELLKEEFERGLHAVEIKIL